MSLSRRFLNLIVDNNVPGIRSLYCIDLMLEKFFQAPLPVSAIGGGSESSSADVANHCNLKHKQAVGAAISMKELQLPNPTFSFKANPSLIPSSINFLAFSDRKIFCTDQSGDTFLFSADTSHLKTMPSLRRRKFMPISFFVPSTDAEANHGGGGSIYIFQSIPDPEKCISGLPSAQFEALVYKPTMASESWCYQQIPPPLFVRDPAYSDTHHRIISYAVVGGGSRCPYICISVEDAGTYCMDTVSNTWTHLGKWKLPFYGKVEYVPELGLWFGLSGESGLLAAADLSTISTMDSQPQLELAYKEVDISEDWVELKQPQLVNLGSGRFCMTRFFVSSDVSLDDYDDYDEQVLVVFTGVNVLPRVPDGNSSGSDSCIENGGIDLEVTRFESRYYIANNGTIIEAVF